MSLPSPALGTCSCGEPGAGGGGCQGAALYPDSSSLASRGPNPPRILTLVSSEFHFHSSPLLSLHLTPLAYNQEILICLHRQPRSNSHISDLEKVTTIHPLSKIETWTTSLLPPLSYSLSPSISTEEQSPANSHDLLYLLIYLFICLFFYK